VWGSHDNHPPSYSVLHSHQQLIFVEFITSVEAANLLGLWKNGHGNVSYPNISYTAFHSSENILIGVSFHWIEVIYRNLLRSLSLA